MEALSTEPVSANKASDEVCGEPMSSFGDLEVEAFDRFLVMAIKPRFSRQIFAGKKKVELRRSNVRFPPDRSLVLVYESSPTQAIVGGFSVGRILRLPLDELWTEVHSLVPSDREGFDAYFEGREEGTAIFIERTFELPIPLDPAHLDGPSVGFSIPQQYTYVNEDTVRAVHQPPV